MDDDEGGEEDRFNSSGAVTHHLPKRVRRDKSAVIIFDETARRDFVTGFHKRKKQRRKVAEMQKKVKERQTRLKERKERRIQRRMALGESVDQNGEHEGDDHPKGEMEEETQGMNNCPIEDIVSYEDAETRTIVSTCPIFAKEDNIGIPRTSNSTRNNYSHSEVKLPSISRSAPAKTFHNKQKKSKSFLKPRGKLDRARSHAVGKRAKSHTVGKRRR